MNISIKKIPILLTTLCLILFTACEKENFDKSTTTVDNFIPEANYTGSDNLLNFSFFKNYLSGISIIGGDSGTNEIISENAAGQLKWTLHSQVEDGISLITDIVFFTQNTDAGTYPITTFSFVSPSNYAYNWSTADMTGTISISDLGTSPGIVSGTIQIERIEPDTTYTYNSTFSEVPIN